MRRKITDSKLGALGSILGGFLGLGFVVFWVTMAVQMGAPVIISLLISFFGVLFLIKMLVGFRSALAKPEDRIASTEIVDISENNENQYCVHCGCPSRPSANFCAKCGQEKAH